MRGAEESDPFSELQMGGNDDAIQGRQLPDDVGLVIESPGAEHAQPVRQQRIGHPEVAMRAIFQMLGHRQIANIFKRHGGIARQALVLRRDLAGAVGEPPGRIGHDRSELVPIQETSQILGGRAAHVQHIA